MSDFYDRIAECSICRREYTSVHFEIMPGYVINVCGNCMKAAKGNFIWLCLNCGKSFLRPKQAILNSASGYGIKEVEAVYEAEIIRGVRSCIYCDPKELMDYICGKKGTL